MSKALKSGINFFKLVVNNILILLLLIVFSEIMFRAYRGRFLRFNPQAYVKYILNITPPNWHYDNTNKYRYPSPYVMFKGKPSVFGHNQLGYRFEERIPSDSLNIAFFGGSTGYGGEDAIINKLVKRLSQNIGSKFSAINFSVVSSNHNQHLHSLVENYKSVPIDLIIFYGGWNETLQTAIYDPRPGYPYNFLIRNQLQPEIATLYKHSQIFQYLDSKFKITHKILSIEDKPYTEKWNREILNNYLLTLSKANDLAKVVTTGKCEIPFIAIYQPFKVRENSPKNFFDTVHKKIINKFDETPQYIDLSDAMKNNEKEYVDIGHVTEKGNDIITDKILQKDKFKKAISSCEIQ